MFTGIVKEKKKGNLLYDRYNKIQSGSGDRCDKRELWKDFMRKKRIFHEGTMK